jgi:hypothetical protein
MARLFVSAMLTLRFTAFNAFTVRPKIACNTSWVTYSQESDLMGTSTGAIIKQRQMLAYIMTVNERLPKTTRPDDLPGCVHRSATRYRSRLRGLIQKTVLINP